MSNTSKEFLKQEDIDCGNADDVIRFLKYTIINGTHWYIALLTAIGMWNITEEDYSGRHYRYVIGGDAFDYFLLVKRLCYTVRRLIPDAEREDLILLGKPPLTLANSRMRELMGEAKYQAYLNYLYGVIVEKAITQYVEDEIRKEQHALVFHKKSNIVEEAFQRVYGATRTELHGRFLTETEGKFVGAPATQENKEFIYWCFKYRIKYCNKEKVASDTRKGLKELNSRKMTRLALWGTKAANVPLEPIIDIGLNWK